MVSDFISIVDGPLRSDNEMANMNAVTKIDMMSLHFTVTIPQYEYVKRGME